MAKTDFDELFGGLVNDVVDENGVPLPPGPTLDEIMKRGKQKVEKRRGDPHKYHTPKMLRCLTYLEAQGKDPGAAHRICYASLGAGANTTPDESIRTRGDLNNKITEAFADVPQDKLKQKLKRLKGDSSRAARAARRGIRIAQTAKSVSTGLMERVQKSLARPNGDVWGHMAKTGVNTDLIQGVWWDWDGERYLVNVKPAAKSQDLIRVRAALGRRTVIHPDWTPNEIGFGRLTAVENWLPDDVRAEIEPE